MTRNFTWGALCVAVGASLVGVSQANATSCTGSNSLPSIESVGWVLASSAPSPTSSTICWTTNGTGVLANTNFVGSGTGAFSVKSTAINTDDAPGDVGAPQNFATSFTVSNGQSSTEHLVLFFWDPTWTAPTDHLTAQFSASATTTTGSASNAYTDALFYGVNPTSGIGGDAVQAITQLNAGVSVAGSTSYNVNNNVPFAINDVSLSSFGVLEEVALTVGAGSKFNLATTFQVESPVPEPMTMALLATGVAGLGLIRRRRAA